MTAKKDVSAVNKSAYTPITTAAFFKFLNLGWAISRFTWARVSSPLMASTECPNPTNTMTQVRWLNQLPWSHPKDSLVNGTTPGCSGFGGHWIPILKTVMEHQMISMTTITVVTIMICRAFSL